MASGRLLPVLIAGGAGVLGGLYIWQAPLKEVTGHSARPQEVGDGRSQAVKDGAHKAGSSVQSPHPSLREGGASPVDPLAQTVAGATPEARKGMSADHNVKTRSNPKEQDGTSGGGVGVAEMRERKMEGRGLPSPQGGDTKARPVEAVANNGEMGGVKKQGRWWLGGW